MAALGLAAAVAAAARNQGRYEESHFEGGVCQFPKRPAQINDELHTAAHHQCPSTNSQQPTATYPRLGCAQRGSHQYRRYRRRQPQTPLPSSPATTITNAITIAAHRTTPPPQPSRLPDGVADEADVQASLSNGGKGAVDTGAVDDTLPEAELQTDELVIMPCSGESSPEGSGDGGGGGGGGG